MQTTLCAHCGASFDQLCETHHYCSSSCRYKARRARKRIGADPPPRHRSCPLCSADFTANTGLQVYCSDYCRRRSQSIRCGKILNLDKRVCRCGKPTEPQAGRPTATKCGDCRREATRRARRAAKMRRRNVISDGFTLAEIADRDQWKCQLCGLKVRHKRQRYPNDPDGPSIDHIVPITKGGQDVRQNAQLAHFGCNARKHNRVWGEGEQLRLIG